MIDAAERPLRIVHVSADFPDPVERGKTRVFQTLLELTSGQFAHEVWSLNRRSPPPRRLVGDMLFHGLRPRLKVEEQGFEYGRALRYTAPARGLFHATMLRQLGDWLGERIGADGLPDLIVGHKLTVEGLAVHRAAQALACPYAITIQGDTDTKIANARPDLTPALRRVFHEAALVFSLAPWSLRAIEGRLGKRTGASRIIPCPTELDTPLAPRPGSGLLSVFHLKNHRRKNLAAMAAALRILGRDGRPLDLAIVGGGDDAEVAAARSAAGSAPGLSFEGPVGRDAMQQRMNAASGFVLPSRRESFGLVFVEALMAGLPVVYPRGMAVSGYFDDCPFALAVKPDDPQELAAAMRHLVDNEVELKAALAVWQDSPSARRFTRAAIAEEFADGLRLAACLPEGARSIRPGGDLVPASISQAGVGDQ